MDETQRTHTPFWGYTRAIWGRAFRNSRSRWAGVIIGLLIAIAILILQIAFGIVPTTGVGVRWVALLLPYAGCLGLLAIGYLWHAAWQIHSEEVQKVSTATQNLTRLDAAFQQERSSLTGDIVSLQRKLENKGPTVSLKCGPSFQRDGLFMVTDEDICGTKFAMIDSPTHTITIEVSADIKKSTEVPVSFRSVPKNQAGAYVSGTSIDVLDECCGDNPYDGKIPMEITYWDLCGNQYFVRWFLHWETVLVRMGHAIEIERDPSSYRLVNTHAEKAAGAANSTMS